MKIEGRSFFVGVLFGLGSVFAFKFYIEAQSPASLGARVSSKF